METINWTQLLSQDVPRRPCLIKTTELGARESEWVLLKGQSRLFLQPFIPSRGCRAALQVAIISERGKSGDETSHGEPRGSSRQAAGVLQGGRLELLQGRDHQSCWTKRNTVELDMTNPRLAEWPKSDSQIALWPIRQLHRFPPVGYWLTTVLEKGEFQLDLCWF